MRTPPPACPVLWIPARCVRVMLRPVDATAVTAVQSACLRCGSTCLCLNIDIFPAQPSHDLFINISARISNYGFI
jgi:hypothetical protein